MKVLLIIIAFVLMGCVTTQPKVEVKALVQQEEKLTQEEVDRIRIKSVESLTQADVAKILMLAINDIEKQGCKAEFLSERGAYIWCRCKDTMRYYKLEALVEKYKEGKRKARENK